MLCSQERSSVFTFLLANFMAAVYSAETLQQKLEKLANTQESIQMTSFCIVQLIRAFISQTTRS
jgi:hypothetical protein